jgi:hypothetical protein
MGAHSCKPYVPGVNCHGIYALRDIAPSCAADPDTDFGETIQISEALPDFVMENEHSMVRIKMDGSHDLAVPSALRVVSPNGQQKCEGTYLLVGNHMPNGMPFWRQKSIENRHDKWLYSSTDGTWNIGGEKARRQGFNCHAAHVFSGKKHNHVMPHELQTIWWRVDGEDFIKDKDIVVMALEPAASLQFQDLQRLSTSREGQTGVGSSLRNVSRRSESSSPPQTAREAAAGRGGPTVSGPLASRPSGDGGKEPPRVKRRPSASATTAANTAAPWRSSGVASGTEDVHVALRDDGRPSENKSQAADTKLANSARRSSVGARVSTDELRRRFVRFTEKKQRGGIDEPTKHHEADRALNRNQQCADAQVSVPPEELKKRLRELLEAPEWAPRRVLRPNIVYYTDTPLD